jgi:putative ABC transport system substrate-binding protein
MKYRIPALLLASVLSLATLGRPGDSGAQNKIPRVGILYIVKFTEQANAPFFFRTLRDRGWIEDRTVSFEYRDAHGDPSQFAEPAEELVRLGVDVIFPIGPPAVRATYAATRTIPIVAHDFETDPVAAGYAESYSHPGGNLTGLFLYTPELATKWLQFLKGMVPGLSRAVVLVDPTSGPTHLQAVRSVAPSFGMKLQILEVRKPEDIDRAASSFRPRPQALIFLPSPMMYEQSARLAKLAMKHRLPATSMFRRFAEAGGALSYGPESTATFETCAVLVAKVLSGAKPADLPVERPTKFELVVNLKTANALGVKIPDSILFRADEVIR